MDCDDTDCTIYNIDGTVAWGRRHLSGDIHISLPGKRTYIVLLKDANGNQTINHILLP